MLLRRIAMLSLLFLLVTLVRTTAVTAAVGPDSLRPDIQAPRGISAGRITGIGTTPAQQAQTGTPVVIVVTGTGRRCGQIRVDFGDQTQPVVVSGNFPITVPAHTYLRPATVTLKATPMAADCEGEASTQLTLKGENLHIPSKVGTMSRDALRSDNGPTPEIKLVVPTTPVQQFACGVSAANYPGSELLVVGKNFGNEAGWIRLLGRFPSGIGLTLQILSWKESEIRAKITMIKGVFDQTVRLQVGGGRMSNEWPIPFTALREQALLPSRFGGVRWCGGKNGRSHDVCRFQDSATYNVFGNHFPNGDTRTQYDYDNYVVNSGLQNGWLIDGYEWVARKGIRYQQVPLFQERCTPERIAFTVYWDWGPNFGYASYKLKLNIVGPAGIPYQ